MSVSNLELSRAISHALRHEPWLYELELDEEGWAPIGALLDALRSKGGDWRSVTLASIQRMLATADKQRHELRGERIRAVYGHSLPGRLRLEASAPPHELFHGTDPEVLDEIMQAGLLPMGRQYVHLSVDRETAGQVGRRKSRTPVVLLVEAVKAHEAGTVFYLGNEKVWLADSVPSEFLSCDAGSASGTKTAPR